MNLRQAAEMALECLDYHWDNPDSELEEWPYVLEAKQALRQALAQPEQEPVAYVTDSGKSAYILLGVDLEDDTPLYTAPPSIEAAVLAEREACAKVCEKERDDLLWREGQTLPQGEPRLIHMAGIAGHCADIIRARGEK